MYRVAVVEIALLYFQVYLVPGSLCCITSEFGYVISVLYLAWPQRSEVWGDGYPTGGVSLSTCVFLKLFRQI